jgi:Ca2+-transporting ATPase
LITQPVPAVLALTLALGVHRMARRGAIIKRLASVEALGSATVVCSDKTGTLTMNEMTTRTLWSAGRRYDVTGEGYGTAGTVRTADGRPAPGLRDAVLPFALCSDARLGADGVIGDPTEAALLVLAAKAGLDPDPRALSPRIGEVPFDPAAKYMATFHAGSGDRVRVHAKGAVDVLLDRCTHVMTDQGPAPLTAERRRDITDATRHMGGEGLRVLGAATAVRDRLGTDEVTGLTLTAIAGIADPPRPQARDAVALAQAAGVTVKMITGDHADTANAIARELGITGDVVTGAELTRMDERELEDRVEDIGVFARVAPEHKVAIVRALSRRGHPPRGDVMHRPPRPPGERILNARRLTAITRTGAVMATGTVAVFAAARALTDDTTTATTMAFTTFVLFQLFNALAARSEHGPVLGRHQLRNRTLWLCLAAVLLLQITAVQAPLAQGVFHTVALTATQWAVCLLTASSVLMTEHAWRAIHTRLRTPH